MKFQFCHLPQEIFERKTIEGDVDSLAFSALKRHVLHILESILEGAKNFYDNLIECFVRARKENKGWSPSQLKFAIFTLPRFQLDLIGIEN